MCMPPLVNRELQMFIFDMTGERERRGLAGGLGVACRGLAHVARLIVSIESGNTRMDFVLTDL